MSTFIYKYKNTNLFCRYKNLWLNCTFGSRYLDYAIAVPYLSIVVIGSPNISVVTIKPLCPYVAQFLIPRACATHLKLI